MGVTTPFLKALTVTKRRLNMIARKAIKENSDVILNLLKKKQLGIGRDSGGDWLSHPSHQSNSEIGVYSDATEDYWAKQTPKPRRGKIAGRPYNFEWTGKTFDTMKIKVSTGGYDILSATKSELESAYGTKLMKLSEQHIEIVNEKYVEPALYKEIFASLNNLL